MVDEKEEAELASDQLTVIQEAIDYLKAESDGERLSLGEIITIQEVYETVKELV